MLEKEVCSDVITDFYTERWYYDYKWDEIQYQKYLLFPHKFTCRQTNYCFCYARNKPIIINFCVLEQLQNIADTIASWPKNSELMNEVLKETSYNSICFTYFIYIYLYFIFIYIYIFYIYIFGGWFSLFTLPSIRFVLRNCDIKKIDTHSMLLSVSDLLRMVICSTEPLRKSLIPIAVKPQWQAIRACFLRYGLWLLDQICLFF